MTGPPDLTVRRRTVTVTAVAPASATATVQWADGSTTTTGVPHVTAYLPAVGDVALVDLAAGSPLLVGRVEGNLNLPDLQTGTTTAGPTSGTVELTLLTSSAVTLDGRTPVKVMFEWGNATPSVADDVFLWRIKDNAATVRESRFATAGVRIVAGHIEWISPTPPTAGSHTYTATVVRTGGTGTMTVAANATVIYQLSVTRWP